MRLALPVDYKSKESNPLHKSRVVKRLPSKVALHCESYHELGVSQRQFLIGLESVFARVIVNGRVLPRDKVQQFCHSKKKNYVEHRESGQSTNRTPNCSLTIKVVGGHSFIEEVDVRYK